MKHWQKQMQSYMKKAVITGASSGIGEQVARLLLEEGWQIAVAARRMDRLKELQSHYGPQRVKIMQIDVTDEHADDSLVELIEQMGGMNLYFHASGIGFQNHGLDKETEEVIGEGKIIKNAECYSEELKGRCDIWLE